MLLFFILLGFSLGGFYLKDIEWRYPIIGYIFGFASIVSAIGAGIVATIIALTATVPNSYLKETRSAIVEDLNKGDANAIHQAVAWNEKLTDIRCSRNSTILNLYTEDEKNVTYIDIAKEFKGE